MKIGCVKEIKNNEFRVGLTPDNVRAYIAAGRTIVEYGKRLTERQDAEIAIYERTKADIERAKNSMPKDDFLDLWENRNDQLRNLGIKLVPLE